MGLQRHDLVTEQQQQSLGNQQDTQVVSLLKKHISDKINIQVYSLFILTESKVSKEVTYYSNLTCTF